MASPASPTAAAVAVSSSDDDSSAPDDDDDSSDSSMTSPKSKKSRKGRKDLSEDPQHHPESCLGPVEVCGMNFIFEMNSCNRLISSTYRLLK